MVFHKTLICLSFLRVNNTSLEILISDYSCLISFFKKISKLATSEPIRILKELFLSPQYFIFFQPPYLLYIVPKRVNSFFLHLRLFDNLEEHIKAVKISISKLLSIVFQ